MQIVKQERWKKMNKKCLPWFHQLTLFITSNYSATLGFISLMQMNDFHPCYFYEHRFDDTVGAKVSVWWLHLHLLNAPLLLKATSNWGGNPIRGADGETSEHCVTSSPVLCVSQQLCRFFCTEIHRNAIHVTPKCSSRACGTIREHAPDPLT